MYEIRTTPTFDADIKKLDRPTAKRIIEKVEQPAQKPEFYDIILNTCQTISPISQNTE